MYGYIGVRNGNEWCCGLLLIRQRKEVYYDPFMEVLDAFVMVAFTCIGCHFSVHHKQST